MSEVDNTSTFRNRPTEGYTCSFSWLPRLHKGFPPRRPIVAAILCRSPDSTAPEINEPPLSVSKARRGGSLGGISWVATFAFPRGELLW